MAEVKTSFIKLITVNKEPRLSISFKIHYLWLIILISLPYLFWEIYWAYKVGYMCIKWHTRLMLYFYLWIAIHGLLYFTVRKMNLRVYQAGIMVFTSVLTALMLAELFLSTFRINETFVERIGNGYNSQYQASGQSWYHTYPPNQKHWITKREYSYERESNSLGFSDMEWPVKKKQNEKRILSLGDSFTEGDGTPYDSSYVALMRTKFAADSNIYVMNAGTCGSDPFINFINYRNRLHPYKPDIIVQTLSSGDMNVDIIVRGGMERFLSSGKVKFRKGPWWEPIYALSYVSRLFFKALGYNEMLLSDADISAHKEELDALVIELFEKYADLAQRNNSKLLVILHPFLFEVVNKEYAYDFSNILQRLKATANIQAVDLLPFYESYISRNHTLPNNYYWKGDGHHNPVGYNMMAEGVYSALTKKVNLK
jgi:lysophospholipase L1-like esterase